MKKRLNRKGFTLAELLVVVGIIVALMAVGFVALISHQRNMHQLEMDGHAKEIFVAAQNHLAQAESQGYLGLAKKTGAGGAELGDAVFGKPSTFADDEDKGVYYLVVNGAGAASVSINSKDSVLSQMLPFASVDETARTKGSYIIRYQKSPAVILDVFYADTTSRRFKHTFSTDEYATLMTSCSESGLPTSLSDAELAALLKNRKAARKNYGSTNAVLGYYGGAASAALAKGETLIAPSVEIENAEKLKVTVFNYNAANAAADKTKNSLKLVFSSNPDAEDAKVNTLYLIQDGEIRPGFTLNSETNSIEFILDDVTASGGHFAQFTKFISENTFAPGGNLYVKAVAENNHVITNIAESGWNKTNSLFGDYDDAAHVVTVSNIRHLLNLDPNVSSLSSTLTIERAEQITDLNWSEFEEKTGGKGATSIYTMGSEHTNSGCFRPVNNGSVNYKGLNHVIKDVKVYTSGPAGLFTTRNGGTVSDLELVDFDVISTGGSDSCAGALAGKLSGGTIEGILVRNTRDGDEPTISSAADAGGLVGTMTGGTVDQCAAAVYVKTSGAAAGGLIGKAGSGTITNSYSGGHTQQAKYQDVPDGSARYNVYATSASSVAGGLIGDGCGATIQYCYSTCSASSAGGVAAGLVGRADSSTSIKYSYSVGKVYSSGGRYTFLGNNAGADLDGLNYVLDSVTPEASAYPSGEHFQTIFSSETSERARKFLMSLTGSEQQAVTYDETLLVNHGGKFLFPTVEQLYSRVEESAAPTDLRDFLKMHYGDWQVPSMLPLPFTLENSYTLSSKITLLDSTKYLTIGIKGESSGKARMFVLQVRDNDGNLMTSPTIDEIEAGSPGSWTRINLNDDVQADRAYKERILNLTVDTASPGAVTFKLDDITDTKGHFSQLCANLSNSSLDLKPGESITMYVGSGKGSWEELILLGKDDPDKGPKTRNSLFANAEDPKNLSDVGIENFRHLQNLDYTVSDVDSGVTCATLKKTLDWDTEKSKYYYGNTSTVTVTNTSGGKVTGTFNGIYTKALTDFDGHGNSIKNLVIKGTPNNGFTTFGRGNAGLFRYVNSPATLTVRDLELVDVEISGTNNVGAIAGEVAGALYANTVLVRSEKKTSQAATTISTTGSGAAGGLVGLCNGNLTIFNSASAMRVKSVSGAAGGLVGEHKTGLATIYASYVGGRTTGGKYSVGNNWNSGWNVVSESGAAGGLIGSLSGSAALEKSFSAASVWATPGSAGGIIGVSSGNVGTVNGQWFTTATSKVMDNVYTVAPVYGVKMINSAGASSSGSLVGSSNSSIGGSADTVGTIFFLPEVYSNFAGFKPLLAAGGNNVTYLGNQSDTVDINLVKPASFFDGADPTINAIQGDAAYLEQETTAYDSTLKNKKEFPFRIWTTFKGKRHFYGDWQPVDSLPTKQVKVHFITVLPDSDGKPRSLGAETVAVQIPYIYKDNMITLPFGVETFGYDFDDWKIYTGWDDNWLESGVPESVTENNYCGSFPGASGGTSVKLPDTALGALKLDEDGAKHLTIVSTYKAKSASVFKLELFDINPSDPSAYYSRLGNFQVLSPTEGKTTWKQLLEEKSIPMLYKSGYVFRGWYIADRSADSSVTDNTIRVYETYFDSETNSLKLRFNESFEKANETLATNVTLKAWFDPVTSRDLIISFVNSKNEPLNGLKPYEIKFDAERGFSSTLTLPGELTGTNPLKPISNNPITVTSGSAVCSLDGLSLTVNIGALSLENLNNADPVKLSIKYEGGVNLKGYVVLYELLDTKADGTTYDPLGGSYVYDWSSFSTISANTFLYDKIGEDDSPAVTTADGALKADLLNYASTLQPSGGFQFNNNVTIYTAEEIADENNEDLSQYRGKYVTQLPNEDDPEHPYPVADVVVIQLERKEFSLSFNTDGANGGSYPTVTYVYGEPLKGTYLDANNRAVPYILDDGHHTPSYTGYTFKYWMLLNDPSAEKGPEITTDTTMPARAVTVKAHRTGSPVPFSILFWLQNTKDDGDGVNEKDDDYTSSIYISNGDDILNGKELMADVGTSISVTLNNGGITLSWTRNEADDGYTIQRSVIAAQWADLEFYLQNSEFTDSEVKVKKAGTVVDVYYDRKVYTLRFDLGFSKPTGNTTVGYGPYTGSGKAYGFVNGSYVELNPDGNGGWTYTDQVETKHFVDIRYKSTTDNGPGTQYGVIGNEVKELAWEEISKQVTVYKPIIANDSYRYQAYTGTDNSKNPYGIYSDKIDRVNYYYRWYQGASSYRYRYYGARYTRSVVDQNTYGNKTYPSDSTIYYAHSEVNNRDTGGFSSSVTTGVGGIKYVLDESNWYVPVTTDTSTQNRYCWTYNHSEFTEPRYLRSVESSGADFNLEFDSGVMKPRNFVKDTETGRWYYSTFAQGQVPFTGDVLSRTSVEEQRYYVSNVTNSGSGGGYSGFLSSNVVSLDDTSVNPFVNPSGVPYYTGTRTESGYTIYYKDITARYGANIFEEWPDSFHQESLYGKLNNSNRNWYFIGWITDDDAWYWDGSDNGNTANTHGNHSTAPNWQIKGVAPHSSIKGKVETMSEEYLKIWANGKYVTYDTTSTNSPYGAGIAHEYHCRYNDETRTYVYRQYFKNPDTNSYNESNSWNPETKLFDRSNPLVSQVSGGSGSNPSGQNPGTFTGYTLVSRQMISGNENNQPGNLGDWRPYSITGVGSGMIMVYKFDPHPGKIELFDEKGSQIILTEDQEVLKYGQSLAFVNDYAPTVDDEHVFRGWYTDPEGAGTRYDPAVDRFPDTAQPKEATDPLNVGLKLYAVVTPTDKTVTLQYTKPAGAPENAVIYFDDGDNDDSNDVPAPAENTVFGPVPYGESLDKYLQKLGTSFANYKLKLAGYTFEGWQYSVTEVNSGTQQEETKAYAFYSADAVENTRTLTPVFTPIPPVVTKKVYVKHVDSVTGDSIAPDVEVTVTVGESAEFTALQNPDNYQCTNPTGRIVVQSVNDAWLSSKFNANTNRYEVVFKYKPFSQSFTYDIAYYLYLPNVNDPADMISIPVTVAQQYTTGGAENNYAYVNFYSLPGDLSSCEVKLLKYYVGDSLKSTTTDPVIFVTKADSIRLEVYVAPKVSSSGEFSKTQTYNGQRQNVDLTGVTGIPEVPSGLPSGTHVVPSCRYFTAAGTEVLDNNLPAAPINAGIYDVQARITISYGEITVLFWESQESGGRHGGTFFIDRCDVTLTSADVTNVFASFGGYDADAGDVLPVGATIGDLAKANAQTDVTVTLPDGVNVSIGMTFTFSADAFRRTESKTLDEYTTNIFDYSLNDSSQAGNFNFYKVYGKLYIWKDYNLYKAYLNG